MNLWEIQGIKEGLGISIILNAIVLIAVMMIKVGSK